jgi:hypothetical protein
MYPSPTASQDMLTRTATLIQEKLLRSTGKEWEKIRGNVLKESLIDAQGNVEAGSIAL